MSIRFVNLVKSFGTPPQMILRGLSGEIQDGEFVSIMGRSGSGKSTLLYSLSTLDQPTSGQLFIDGSEVSQLSEKEIHAFRNRRLGFVFQFHYLLPELTALENVLMPAMKNGEHETRRSLALGLLREFGIESKADRFPGQLSGGEQQRVAIARSLVMEPHYLFADEPTGNLDTTNSEIVLGFFEKIHRERGTTILMVTHDPGFARRATRQIHLADGQVVP